MRYLWIVLVFALCGSVVATPQQQAQKQRQEQAQKQSRERMKQQRQQTKREQATAQLQAWIDEANRLASIKAKNENLPLIVGWALKMDDKGPTKVRKTWPNPSYHKR